jgi:hypothetical protein
MPKHPVIGCVRQHRSQQSHDNTARGLGCPELLKAKFGFP